MCAKPVHTLDQILASVGVRFDEEACELFNDSVFGVMKQIKAVPEAGTRKHLETCRELFKAGQATWLKDLVELVYGYAEKLVQVAMSCPDLVTDDPTKWIRLQINALLSRHLRQELSIETLAEHATQRSLALREAKRNAIASNQVPLDSGPNRVPRYSRVGAWFRWVAEDGPDFDRSESGFHEPWLAPAFVDDMLRERMTSGRLDRLTAAQTDRVIRRVETRFAGRFDHVLQQVEHGARITLGTNGAVPFAIADSDDRSSSTNGKPLEVANVSKIPPVSERDNGKVVWPGTARQLGDEVFEQYRDGKIPAKTERDALKKACQFFVKEDGTTFKAANIFQSLRNRKDVEQNPPSLRPKALSTLVKRFANVTSRKPSL